MDESTTKYLRPAVLAACLVLVFVLAGCAGFNPKPASTPTPAPDLVFYDWADDMPQSILDNFTKETGIHVRYETYDSTEEAVANLLAGKTYDVVIMENEYIPTLIEKNRLAKLSYRFIKNSENVSKDFLNLAYDPKNQYSLPFTWGTTGIMVRTDRVLTPITRWEDLWNLELKGMIGIRRNPRDIMGMTELSLGYSVNSETPSQVSDALAHLLVGKNRFRIIDDESEKVMPLLESGEVNVLVGWAADMRAAQEMGIPVKFIVPEEGVLYWGDSYVIDADSPNQQSAAMFINYLLRPEVSAEITNQVGYATANQAALKYVSPELLADKVIFPDALTLHDILQNAGMILPLSANGEKMYQHAWERFMQKVENPN